LDGASHDVHRRYTTTVAWWTSGRRFFDNSLDEGSISHEAIKLTPSVLYPSADEREEPMEGLDTVWRRAKSLMLVTGEVALKWR